VRELLSVCGLNPNFADRNPHEMSGGQRQRVGMQRVCRTGIFIVALRRRRVLTLTLAESAPDQIVAR